MKKLFAMLLALVMVLSLAACAGNGDSKDDSTKDSASDSAKDSEKESESQSAEPVELVVFAAASLTESLTAIGEKYMADNQNVKLSFNFDSSGKLLTQIKEGAVCDLSISAAPKQMNALDGTLKDDAEKNPVGQYTQKIFAYYGIDENAIASKLTYGSNVKEVTTAVSEGTVDCGIIYASDAYSAKLTVAAEATAEMCGQVIYPAAVLNTSKQQDAASAFLKYLQGAEASAEFEKVLFTPLSK